MTFVKQVSNFIKFVRLNRLQNHQVYHAPSFFFMSILKSPIIKRFPYFSISLLIDAVCSTKMVERLFE